MQNQQMAAAMAAGMNANVGGPVDGTPMMGNLPRPAMKDVQDPRNLINTYIYDYFIRNNHYQLARSMIESDLKINLQPGGAKQSPDNRNVNGVDGLDDDKEGLPLPILPSQQRVENSFLMDWWLTFWDIYSANRGRGTAKSAQYIQTSRNLAQMNNDNRNQRVMMNNMNPAQYRNMMQGMPNGMDPKNLQRAAAMNNRNPSGAGPMANMNVNKQAMMSAQMQRDGSGMDMNGQRPQSPGSVENAPSPNKRQRVEGGMNAGNQFTEFAQQAQNVQQKSIEGMNPGVQGSPMNNQGLDGHQDMFAGNQPRPGMPNAPGQPQGNHALQDYQMQLMLLEQQNKKRLLMARQEQDNMSAGPHNQSAVGAPGFPPAAMSPQGSRAGPSPNPTDQMNRKTPKLGQQVLPGSPMPDASMQPQRGSPAPGMSFDPSQMPPGMPPQFPYNQMPQNPMMRPPSSHPGGFNGQQMTPQQIEAMRQNGGMPNGAWRGPGGPQGMMQGQAQQMGGPMNQPQQRNPMPPPPAPPAGEQPRTQEPSPSQPAQAPPTPNQTNKANPKKKATKDNKKPAKKGANTGATPAASGDEPPPTPTPSTPITPMHKNSFGQNGQQPAQPAAQAQSAAPQSQPAMDNVAPFGALGDNDPNNLNFDLEGFGGSDALENFDFDSFLHVGDDGNGFALGDNFGFEGVEAGGDM